MGGEPKLAIGIDAGGTNIKCALLNSEGKVLLQTSMLTDSNAGPEGIKDQIVLLAKNVLDNCSLKISDIEGIGIAFAGGIKDTGKVEWTVHVGEGWPGYDLGAALRSKLHSELYFALDVQAAALGEGYFGAARGVNFYAVITVGTGIGAGIVVGGKVFTGVMGIAGCIGHTIVDDQNTKMCACGNYGCLETLVASGALVERAAKAIKEETKTKISDLCKGKLGDLTPSLIHKAAKMGDALAIQIFEEAGHFFGLALLNLINILSPQMVVVGGGVSGAGDFFLKPAREEVKRRAWSPIVRNVPIVQAQLGDMSGTFGAVSMVFNNIRVRQNDILEISRNRSRKSSDYA
jgi:glucokinase